jgi:thioester reductase-like protein
LDEQLKIRGYRIEPAEVELALCQHPAVSQAVVVGDSSSGMTSLGAYFVGPEVLPIKSLRPFLATLLPDYMIPQFFIQLKEIPLTNNGKVNKALLPRPGTMRPDTAADTTEKPRNKVEQRLLELWREILCNPAITSTDNFFQMGGNSIRAIQIVTRLQENFRVSVNDLYSFQNVRALAANIVYSKDNLKKNARSLLKTIRKQAKLRAPGSVPPASPSSPRLQNEYQERVQKYAGVDLQNKNNFRHFFLTGATGYLGTYLLKSILERTNARVSVLVRSRNHEGAVARVMNKLDFYFGKTLAPGDRSRVVVYSGDLTEECFGLAPENYQRLAQYTDCVINCAANVRHYGSYEDFKAINLSAVNHLISFCSTGTYKPLQHISTISVASGASADHEVSTFSEFDSGVGQVSGSYYVQTKLEAEKLLLASRQNGLSCNIFRVGNLTFDATNGKFQENIEDNAFYSLFKSYVELKYLPSSGRFEFSHVDEAADAILRLIESKNLVNETYHIHNPLTVTSDQLAGYLQSLGYEINLLEAEEFVKYLLKNRKLRGDLINNILLRFNFFDAAGAFRPVRIASDKTILLLSRMGFEWTPIKKVHIRRMMEYCMAVNFMEVQPVSMSNEEHE